jgi:threonine dehydrogenase-like Zn-dependent dehydrogenase
MLATLLYAPGDACSQVVSARWPQPFVRRLLSYLMDLVLERKIRPGKVFDLALPLNDVAEGYKAMDGRPAIKALLCV